MWNNERMQLIPRHSRGLVVLSVLFFGSWANAAPSEWKLYQDPAGHYQINYPTTWQVLTRGNAVVITSPGDPSLRGVFGITPRVEKMSIQDQITQEFKDPQRPSDLQKAPARLGDQPATKVWGSSKKDPNIRMVEYYVQEGQQQYYILFQAPHTAMANYSPIFNRMIGSMKFLQ